jgi:prepilin-type processing-associated H-X9-DG protein
MSNLRQLAVAWMAYYQSNNEKLVNGGPIAPGGPCVDCPSETDCAAVAPMSITGDMYSDFHINETPWVGVAWVGNPAGGFLPAEECCQKCAIRTGALWPYVRQEKIYRCPTGEKNALITYAIIDSMNGKYMFSTDSGEGIPSLCLKIAGQVKRPAERIVFLDEGSPTPDSFAVYYYQPKWFDPPTVRHAKGSDASYADGHAARIMWRAQETFQAGTDVVFNYAPTTCLGKNDLYKMQMRCWGKIGYTLDPSCNYSLED